MKVELNLIDHKEDIKKIGDMVKKIRNDNKSIKDYHLRRKLGLDPKQLRIAEGVISNRGIMLDSFLQLCGQLGIGIELTMPKDRNDIPILKEYSKNK